LVAGLARAVDRAPARVVGGAALRGVQSLDTLAEHDDRGAISGFGGDNVQQEG
jgi:hypothetical protein